MLDAVGVRGNCRLPEGGTTLIKFALSDFYVFEPDAREVPFSDEAAEVRAEKAAAKAAGRPLMVLIRPRMVITEVAHPEAADLRCPDWFGEADLLVMLGHDHRFHILKGAI